MKFFFRLLLAVLMFHISGCQKTDSSLAGTWGCEYSGNDAVVSTFARRMELKLAPDGSCYFRILDHNYFNLLGDELHEIQDARFGGSWSGNAKGIKITVQTEEWTYHMNGRPMPVITDNKKIVLTFTKLPGERLELDQESVSSAASEHLSESSWGPSVKGIGFSRPAVLEKQK